MKLKANNFTVHNLREGLGTVNICEIIFIYMQEEWKNLFNQWLSALATLIRAKRVLRICGRNSLFAVGFLLLGEVRRGFLFQFLFLFIGLSWKLNTKHWKPVTKKPLFAQNPDKNRSFLPFFAFFAHFINFSHFFTKTLQLSLFQFSAAIPLPREGLGVGFVFSSTQWVNVIKGPK